MNWSRLRAATIGSFAAAALAVPAGALLDRFAGVDVVLVLPHSEDAVAINRATFEAGESVAAIYGTPVGGDVEASAGKSASAGVGSGDAARAGGAAASRAAATPPRTRVLFPRAERLLVPPEDPALTLLKIDKQAGDNPLQAVTVAFFARQFALGAAAVGVLLAIIGRVRSRRARPATAASS
jgi:hypothetical protein